MTKIGLSDALFACSLALRTHEIVKENVRDPWDPLADRSSPFWGAVEQVLNVSLKTGFVLLALSLN